jgi:hypothetical protein
MSASALPPTAKGRTLGASFRCPAELYAASTRRYDGLPELTYPFHDRDVIVTARGRLCLHRKRPPCWPVRGSASRRSTTAFGSPVSCTMISVTSTWSRRPCNPSTTRSARGCHPCLRYVALPMSPGPDTVWTGANWRRGRDSPAVSSDPPIFPRKAAIAAGYGTLRGLQRGLLLPRVNPPPLK